MPILTDIMDHDLFGPLLREIATVRTEGRVEGERAFLKKLVSNRFGAPPEWVSHRINQLGVEQLEDLGVRLMDAPSLEELLGAD
jgi:hypothetical protein